MVRAGEGSMTEQNGRAYGGNGRSSALESAFGRPPGVESSFAPGAPPVPPPDPATAAAGPGPAPAVQPAVRRGRVVRPPARRDPGHHPAARVALVEAGRRPRPLAGRPLAGLARRPAGLRRRPPARRSAPRRSPAAPGAAGACATSRFTAAVVLLVAGLLTGIAGGVVGYLAADRITPALLDPDATLSQVSPSVNRPARLGRRHRQAGAAGGRLGRGEHVRRLRHRLRRGHRRPGLRAHQQPRGLPVRHRRRRRLAAGAVQRPVRGRRPDRRPGPEDRPGGAEDRQARR